jgi:hypothetical protein
MITAASIKSKLMFISLTLSSSALYHNPFLILAQSLTIFYNYHMVLENIHHYSLIRSVWNFHISRSLTLRDPTEVFPIECERGEWYKNTSGNSKDEKKYRFDDR